MRHVITLSYGIASWAAGKRVVERHGPENAVLVFTDTKYEDADTYAWGESAAKNIGAPLVVIADGRDPWQVFHDVRLIGNTHADPCSRVLKREPLARWLAENCDPKDTMVYFGIHWSESDRFSRYDRDRGEWLGIKHRMAALGWTASAPLCEPPLLGAHELHEWAKREGLWEQALYREGWSHANCAGRCVKQGKAGWARLLRKRPESYLECEEKEQAMRDHLGKDVAILRDRRNGTTKPLTLRAFRLELETVGQQGDLFDDGEGGCACFAGSD